MSEAEIVEIEVESIFGLMSQRAVVRIAVPDGEARVSPADARTLAMSLLEAAEAVETDQALAEFVLGELKLGTSELARLLAHLHAARERPER